MKGKATLEPESEKITYYAQEIKVATGAKSGNKNIVGRIYLPTSWAGKKVLCLLLEEPEDPNSDK